MYVIYKENIIPGVGGVHPNGINAPLAYYNGWNLASCPTNKLHYYKEFDFIPVSNEIAEGLLMLDAIPSNVGVNGDGSPDNMLGNISLDAESLIMVDQAKKFINNLGLKIVTRAKIREIKDIEDDLVDLKRTVHTLIRFAVDDWNAKTSDEKKKSIYMDVMNGLSDLIIETNNGIYDINQDLDKMINIVAAEVEIAELVNNYYLTKKL